MTIDGRGRLMAWVFRRPVLRGCCGAGLAAAIVLALSSCSQSDEEKARQRAAEAREKTREEAHELAHQAKQAAHALNRSVNQAVNGTGARPSAGVKLDHAAVVAKVKAKLANDVGLSTVTGVDVDVSGDVVTLRGSVSSVEQKRGAENAARQVEGVGRVVNDLQVRP